MRSSSPTSKPRRSTTRETPASKAAIEQLGKRIKSLRLTAALTQEQAAEQSGLDGKHWSDMERGETNPTVTTLVAVASGLSVELFQLFQSE